VGIQLSCDKCGNNWTYEGAKTHGYVTCSQCKHPIRIGMHSGSERDESLSGVSSISQADSRTGTLGTESAPDWFRHILPSNNLFDSDLLERQIFHYDEDVMINLIISLTPEAVAQIRQSKEPYRNPSFEKINRELIDAIRKSKPGTRIRTQTVMKSFESIPNPRAVSFQKDKSNKQDPH
jgi:hypothetical protein